MSLELIIGPMYSGKSFELIRKIRETKILELKYMVIKPSIDKRYTKESYIVTHNRDKEECVVTDNLLSLFDYKGFQNLNTIFIDEGQFFNNLKLFVIKCVDEYNLNVVISGLDGDSNREPIGEILQLIPLADECVKKTSKCIMCKDRTKAPFTFKKVDNNKIVDVGSTDKYIPLCRKHYIEQTLLKKMTNMTTSSF